MKTALDAVVERTVCRKLQQLDYLSSDSRPIATCNAGAMAQAIIRHPCEFCSATTTDISPPV